MTTPLASTDWSGLEILDAEECFRRLARSPVGRLGFIDRGEPVILPVNFAVDGRALVFRTAAGSMLSAAIMQQPVCLEIDQWDTVRHTGWSVVVKGMAESIVDADEIGRFGALPVRPWSRPDLRHQWVRIRSEEVTGRQIVTTAERPTSSEIEPDDHEQGLEALNRTLGT